MTAGTTSQLEKLATTQGFVSDVLNQFVNQLVLLLPEELNVVYMCNNGIEANDLAMLLAREYTKNKDLVTFEGAYHGYLLPLLDVSPKISTTTKDNVHIVPFPDMYRGPNSQKQTVSLNIAMNKFIFRVFRLQAAVSFVNVCCYFLFRKILLHLRILCQRPQCQKK